MVGRTDHASIPDESKAESGLRENEAAPGLEEQFSARKIGSGLFREFSVQSCFNGKNVLDFKQAHPRALALQDGELSIEAPTRGYIVSDALEAYLTDYRTRGKDWRGAEFAFHAHIQKPRGTTPLARLTAERLRRWLT